ncbi:MAG: ATP-binding protein [Bacteroidia bacterium]|nr:ATP-binding protein [Bacteroidia bacterium]
MTPYRRKLFTEIMNHLEQKEFTIILGARQTGKTTLLNQVYQELSIQSKNVYILSLEEPILLHELNKHPESIFQFIKLYGNQKIYVLFDEIQYLHDPSNFLKYIFDKYYERIKIIATGSSAFYIDKKFKDSLAGRKRIFELYTLDFEEYLLFQTQGKELIQEWKQIIEQANYISFKRKEIEIFFNEYLTFGGYPAVVLQSDQQQKIFLLKELYTSFLKRDIYEGNIQNEDKFYFLFTILAQQTGSLLNVNELANTLKLSVTAIENYIYILRKCFHIRLVRPFYRNIRKELTKMPKVYFNDLGMRNILLNQFIPISQRLDKGMLIENYAFIRLRQLYDYEQIRFWRTADGNEVDFVIIKDYKRGFALEIKYDYSEFRVSKYQKFIDEYPEFPLQCRAYVAEKNETGLIAF